MSSFFLGGYSVNGGSGENTYGRKSLGQELRVNNVTSSDFTNVQHGNRALVTKDMRKTQGKNCVSPKKNGYSAPMVTIFLLQQHQKMPAKIRAPSSI